MAFGITMKQRPQTSKHLVSRERSPDSNNSTGIEARGEVKTLHGKTESKAEQKPGKSDLREQIQLLSQGLTNYRDGQAGK